MDLVNGIRMPKIIDASNVFFVKACLCSMEVSPNVEWYISNPRIKIN